MSDHSQPIAMVMPDFVSGTHAFRHHLHSAMACLDFLRVPPSRISIRAVGRCSFPDGAIVGQSPRPGAPLAGDVRLDVAGASFHHYLPVALWDSGGDAEPGTRELLEVLDDPLKKLSHWMYEGASLLRLAQDNLAACARWISLFGFVPEEWPRTLWYRLALLLLDLPAVAGSENAARTALERVFDLPVRASCFRSSVTMLRLPATTRLGVQASRPGVDFILGDSFQDIARLRVEVGPVPLDVYEYYACGDGARLVNRLLALVLPLHQDYELGWLMPDPAQPPRLGIAERNCRLGLNSYLGSAQNMPGSEL